MKNRTAGDSIEAYDHMVDRCLLRAEGMRKLITDLLDMTRIESGEKNRELREIDVAEAAESAIENVKIKAADRRIELKLRVDVPAGMIGDPGEIEIVLNNLVSNAVKYNRDGGQVDVCLGGDEEWVKIIVSDTGFGMTDKDTERLFNDFVRIKNTHTRDVAGSGLGLSIVKKIAELYSGNCSVESEVDKGSTFVVNLKRQVNAPE